MKKLLPFLALLSFIVLINTVIGTYAVFETDVGIGTETPLASWQIAINGSLLDDIDQTFEVNSVNWTTSADVLPGRASPGLSGYFEILIDPTGSDVAMSYEVELDFESLNNTSIQFISIKDSLNNDLTDLGNNTYGGLITLEDVQSETAENIRVNFTWINDDENNAADSVHVNQLNSQINIPVIVRISQTIE